MTKSICGTAGKSTNRPGSNVLAFPKRPSRKIQPDSVLTDLLNRQAKGDLRGLMTFDMDPEGDLKYSVSGDFADRLQVAAYVLSKALVMVNDKMFAAGSAGHTYTPGVDDTIPRQR